MHPSTRRLIDGVVARRMAREEIRKLAVVKWCLSVIKREKAMAGNEVEIWKNTDEVRAATDLADAQTRQMIAENTLGVVEQSQGEAHRQHERKLELQRLDNEHEINKLSTIDVTAEQTREYELATKRHDSVVARQKGLIKGLIWGTSVGVGFGFAAGLGIGLLF